MNISPSRKQARKGFTLIEMIGVLAVIAILASLLIPKIYEAINNARVNNAALSYNSIKTALADHFAKFGSLTSSNGVTITAGVGEATNFDNVLITEGFSDKPFNVKIGTGSYVQVVAGSSAATVVAAANEAYDLDGSGTTINDTAGSAVVECVIPGVTGGDALALSTLLDGATMSAADATLIDLKGRVKYAAPVSGITTVYIYVTHR
jgi:general secretion pathway protein G